MAKVKGDVGQVKFDDGGSSVNPVLGTTSWSMSISKDIQEITHFTIALSSNYAHL